MQFMTLANGLKFYWQFLLAVSRLCGSAWHVLIYRPTSESKMYFQSNNNMRWPWWVCEQSRRVMIDLESCTSKDTPGWELVHSEVQREISSPFVRRRKSGRKFAGLLRGAQTGKITWLLVAVLNVLNSNPALGPVCFVSPHLSTQSESLIFICIFSLSSALSTTGSRPLTSMEWVNF